MSKPANAPWLMPYLAVKDAGASLEFYQAAFGFSAPDFLMRDDRGKISHGGAMYKGQMLIMFAPEGAFGSSRQSPATSGNEQPAGLYVYVDDVDAFYANAKANGAVTVAEPEDMFWGDRTVVVQDPDGYVWTFATQVAEFDPANVPS